MSIVRLKPLAVAPLVALLAACGGGEDAGGQAQGDFCDTIPFTAPAASPYRLPYAVGTTFTVIQGNCPSNPNWGHHDSYAYDFDMPLGTPVIAMRGGTVIFENDQYSNDDHVPGHENNVWILHDDGTIAQYGHLSPGGNAVAVNQVVVSGDLLGLSGNSGNSAGPHLHVWVYANGLVFNKTNTVPQTFSNAGGVTEPSGELIQGNAYTALP